MRTTSLQGNITPDSTSRLNGILALNTTPRKLRVEWTPLNKSHYISVNSACQLQKPRSNMSYQQHRLMNFLKRNPDYMAIATDKGLGAALIERTTYDNKLWSEHLSDSNAYREILPNQIHAVKVHMKYKLGDFFSRCQKILPEHELIYFSRLRDQGGDSLISKFYMLAKVLKTPLKTRPVVATWGQQ